MSKLEGLIPKVEKYVKEYMSNFDGSHDFNHIKRVVGLAHTLYSSITSSADDQFSLNSDIITLAALLHDVGDSKYLPPDDDPNTMIRTLLVSFGADSALAIKIQTICSAVSYSQEIKDPQKVLDLIQEYPELAVVQDADRLDSLGAVGIGRVFTYGGARTERGMSESMALFEKKLFKLEGCMKTRQGREMARVRAERLRKFRAWWDEEMGVEEVGEAVLEKTCVVEEESDESNQVAGKLGVAVEGLHL